MYGTAVIVSVMLDSVHVPVRYLYRTSTGGLPSFVYSRAVRYARIRTVHCTGNIQVCADVQACRCADVQMCRPISTSTTGKYLYRYPGGVVNTCTVTLYSGIQYTGTPGL